MVRKKEPSPALQIIGKMKDTLAGRCAGILVNDGSDGTLVAALRKAALDAGATVRRSGSLLPRSVARSSPTAR